MHRLAGVLCARRSSASRTIVVPGRMRRKLPRAKANNKCRGDQGGRPKKPASDLYSPPSPGPRLRAPECKLVGEGQGWGREALRKL